MDEDRFEPRIGTMRDRGSARGRKYLHNVLAAAARAGAPRRGSGPRFTGSRIGRGRVAGRALGLGDRYAGLRNRRAMVKVRLVRIGAKGHGAALAHLRYIQRDGVSRDGEAGSLYARDEHEADGKAFLERCTGDRHQFRLILSAEDGADYDDLRPLVRRFMTRMEEDLGTRLDWVAADHRDTLHPHTHVLLRGTDDRGRNLVIAPRYIAHGMRERLAGLVSLDLGPRTDVEIERRLRLEVEAERLTSLDRALCRSLPPDRIAFAGGRSAFEHGLRAGRLNKLETLGLAERLGDGRWRLHEDLEPALRRLGERGDIVRTMQRALTSAGLERGPAERQIHSEGLSAPVVGRLVARGLSDESGDRHYLLVDGIDGRCHYVDIGSGPETEPLPDGAVIRIAPRATGSQEADRRIAAVAAAHDGRYSAEVHQSAGASATFAETHVRRLEAIRRGVGGVERLADGSWAIGQDFLNLAERFEALRHRARPVDVVPLSPLPLERLGGQDGATWLDRELEGPMAALRDQGFGHEVRIALERRRVWLIGQGLAAEEEGAWTPRPGFVAILQRRELLRVAAGLRQETGLDFLPVDKGQRVEGIVRRRLDLASGRFAMIDNGREFALVPWRPVLARAMQRPVSGLVRETAISWTIGRQRALERG